jgi:hypothetical protein
LSDDHRHLQIRLDDLKAGRVVRMKLNGIMGHGGHELLHPEVAYTLNVLPGVGDMVHVAKPTQQPTERIAETDAGWLRLTWGDPWDRFNDAPRGWRLGKAALAKEDDTRFAVEAGHDLLVLDALQDDDLVVTGGLRPGLLAFQTWLPRGGSAGISMPGGAKLVLQDRSTKQHTAGRTALIDADGTVLAESSKGWMGPGQWHRVEVAMDNDGIESVSVQDTPVLGAVALPGGSQGDLHLLGAHAPGGFADIRIKPDQPEIKGGTPITGEPSRTVGEVDVELHEGDLYLSGGTGHVVYDVDLPPACTVHLETRFQPIGLGWIDLGGTRVLLGESPDGGPTTGTIEGHDDVYASLVADKTWVRVSIELTPHVARRYMTVKVGGLTVAQAIVNGDVVSGPISIGHQSQTGWVAVRNLRVVP